ncbi:MAG: hypothetical protein NZ748_00605, partial [Candidatus Marinimicrobia bacterium]|nr:hypothetical protein [Candidatus Neomarinimicrobiota bacterium]
DDHPKYWRSLYHAESVRFMEVITKYKNIITKKNRRTIIADALLYPRAAKETVLCITTYQAKPKKRINNQMR